MNVDELSAKVTTLIEEIEVAIIKHMKENDIQVYSFIDNKDKPMIILDDECKTKDYIVALSFSGYNLLGIMLESELTPLRCQFLNKAETFHFGDMTDSEIEYLRKESEDGWDGFSLLLDSTLYPLDTLLDVARYIEKL